jgi:hypothetical protein
MKTAIMSLEDAQAIVATKTAPKVTKDGITAKIKDVKYIHEDLLTICIITMQNGFMVNGQSAPASPDNYDQEVGMTYAYENAFKQLWVLEGYLLKERLSVGQGTMEGYERAKAI